MKLYRKFLQLVVALFSTVLVFILFANVWIIGSTRDQIIEIDDLDLDSRTALILGTSYNTVEGEKNQFFQDRMTTASVLYKLGTVSEIIL